GGGAGGCLPSHPCRGAENNPLDYSAGRQPWGCFGSAYYSGRCPSGGQPSAIVVASLAETVHWTIRLESSLGGCFLIRFLLRALPEPGSAPAPPGYFRQDESAGRREVREGGRDG